ncbi:MAG: hypothetical protein QOI42_401 [Frankiaceae bacterium]|jgi:hypothetical protein|nr:hypothetical protein [Frankiaceae bacterium]
MSIGRHARVRDNPLVPALGWACAVAAAVLAAVTADPRWLRLAVVLALVAVVPHALAAARAPRATDVRGLRREVTAMRSELAVRAAPIVEVILVPAGGPSLSRPTSVNGNAYVDEGDRRRLVLDLVALEDSPVAERR